VYKAVTVQCLNSVAKFGTALNYAFVSVSVFEVSFIA